MCDTFSDREVFIKDLVNINNQMEDLKGLITKRIGETKKRFWEEIGADMGKTGMGCEKAAKEAKIQISMY